MTAAAAAAPMAGGKVAKAEKTEPRNAQVGMSGCFRGKAESEIRQEQRILGTAGPAKSRSIKVLASERLTAESLPGGSSRAESACGGDGCNCSNGSSKSTAASSTFRSRLSEVGFRLSSWPSHGR